MTDKVIPSYKGDSDAYIVATLIEKGARTSGWIQESASALVADNHSDISGSPLNAFSESHSSSSFDVTIDTGEGFVGGAWVARDSTTTVTLDSSTNGQTVYLGWDHDATETVRINTDPTGSNANWSWNSEDKQLAIWTFDTDGSGVTSVTDERNIGQTSDLGTVTTSSGSEFDNWVGTGAAGSTANGTVGNSNNEIFRVPGATSDALMAVEDGTGNLNLVYNAYYDGSDWKYIVDGEAQRIRLNNGAANLMTAASGTADNVISWNSVGIDASGNLKDRSSGTTIFDEANQHVPQSQLDGPASSLTSYPLPSGDIDDGSGSNLDADTVDGQEASEIGGGTWTSIDTYKDNDTNTGLSIDTGTLSTLYDQYRIIIYWEPHDNGENAHTDVRLRVNNDSSSVYEYGAIDQYSGTFEAHTDQNGWANLASGFGGKYASCEAIVTCPTDHTRSGYLTDDLALGYPEISQVSQSDPDAGHLHTGQYEKNPEGIDRLTFEGLHHGNNTFTATGIIHLYGRNFSW